MAAGPKGHIGPRDEDKALTVRLVAVIVKQVGGLDRLCDEVPKLLRQAIDEVIDQPRTGRLVIEEIETTEKTYIGTKVEILLRNFLGFPKGLLDLSIDGHDVDIKNTVSGGWMIPPEAIDKPCLLLSADEASGLCSFGLIIASADNLTKGANRDKKLSVSAAGKQHTHWFLHEAPYPRNFWRDLKKDDVKEIFGLPGGTERLATLFEKMQRQPISRSVVEGVARQRDYMKRLRKNGGARDILMAKGIALLSGNYDADLIDKLGLPKCEANEFISISPATSAQRKLLQDAGHL